MNRWASLDSLSPCETALRTRGGSFRLDIQGLRALAVILVILAHADKSRFSGGFVGVDVFFVISGYVITGLLIRAGDAKIRHKLLKFYTRRIRRFMPAAVLVLSSPWLQRITGWARTRSATGIDARRVSIQRELEIHLRGHELFSVRAAFRNS
jgi:peptidoglycan/LPS O-acetylase OafA/YrhL